MYQYAPNCVYLLYRLKALYVQTAHLPNIILAKFSRYTVCIHVMVEFALDICPQEEWWRIWSVWGVALRVIIIKTLIIFWLNNTANVYLC